mgnify:CR=1 FL=1
MFSHRQQREKQEMASNQFGSSVPVPKAMVREYFFISMIPTFQTQQVAPTTTTQTNTNLASAGQIKFARDLIQKNFLNNERDAMDFLAHSLEIPMSDIPEISTWESSLSRDMVGPMIDSLESMWKRNKKGSGGF